MGLLDGILGGASGGEGSPIGAITDLLGGQEGGLGGLMNAFEKGGLGGVAQSWIASGANLPISAEQIQAVLSSGMVADFAAKLGVDPTTAADTLAKVLPQVIDHLTPDGQLPTGGQGGFGGLGGLADILGKLKG
ncbi:MAG: YidB family protein [Phenylobacterium sp.]|uniref:YidB family protein n=1 Tax=Phenylobacterium sp. TaxID=1871053 RepID=UPI00271A416F|nr:YidB family protein [Phenylobacterium sp.]MDO9432892.1 YidB family protein [Phenylobacterium sp.]